jgi:glutamate synthase (NADPH/NADH) large chain
LPEGRLTVHLNGSAGQSLGCFLAQGVAIEVTGDANDYVGKGLSGGIITLRPPPEHAEAAARNAIIGNTCLYGATSGKLFAAGQAGERFAVRNSGAVAVVEGCGANGCEYMTDGLVAILGPVDANFAAGMTGGMAFVYDEAGRFPVLVNPDTVEIQGVETAHWKGALKDLIAEHVARTGSVRGQSILEDWPNAVRRFWQVCPKEMLSRLEAPLTDGEAVAAE